MPLVRLVEVRLVALIVRPTTELLLLACSSPTTRACSLVHDATGNPSHPSSPLSKDSCRLLFARGKELNAPESENENNFFLILIFIKY